MNKQLIKDDIALGLKQCMKNKDFDKITINDICVKTGISRQTFYRHFKDKYDLLNWVFDIILNNSFDQMGEGKSLYDALYRKLSYIKDEQLFFTQGFKLDTQNNLKDHDYELILAFYRNLIRNKTNHPLDVNLDFALQMYCQGSVYMTVQWLLHGCNDSVDDIVSNLINAIPSNLYHYFIKVNLIKSDNS